MQEIQFAQMENERPQGTGERSSLSSGSLRYMDSLDVSPYPELPSLQQLQTLACWSFPGLSNAESI